MTNEVGSVLEGILGAVIAGITGRGIASQGENITNAGIGVALQCRSDFVLAVRYHRLSGGMGGMAVVSLIFNTQLVGEVTGGPSCSVGDTYK